MQLRKKNYKLFSQEKKLFQEKKSKTSLLDITRKNKLFLLYPRKLYCPKFVKKESF